MQKQIIKFGQETILELGLGKFDPELVEIIGKLHFRTSYGQNALQHSKEVAELSGLIAGELGENVNLAKRAGLLHDIGKAIDHEVEGSHVDIGVDIAKKYHENEVVVNAIASHHGDTSATSVIDKYVNIREEVGNKIKGVDKAFAVQAGRELRVIVKPEEISDLEAHKVAREVKEQIEANMKYPGTIKITVVRETRAQEEAK